MDWILIKWGGSLITDKRSPDTARPEVIGRLCEELATVRAEQPQTAFVLGHGSGSFGHAAAARLGLTGQTPEPLGPERLADAMAVRLVAARLHAQVSDGLVQRGVPAWSWAPSVALRARGGRPTRGDVGALCRAVTGGLLPVTYGDVLLDSQLGASIASTEQVMDFLIARLRRRGIRPRRLLWMGETAGIYDREGRTIPVIDGKNRRQVEKMIDAPAGIDVTGGMLLRLRTAWKLARRGVESWILDGTVPGLFEAALRGEDVPGTRVRAEDRPR